MPERSANARNLTLSLRYNSLPARRVDLVGDYAGEELFVIEGDSILLECFQEPGLDFDGASASGGKWDAVAGGSAEVECS